MTTITKKELVNRIADRTGQTKVVTKEIIQLFLDEIINELATGNRLEFRDFGVFEVKFRKARRAQNPRTLEKVHVPPKKVVKFKVGRVMREKVGEQGPADGEGDADAATPSSSETPPAAPPSSGDDGPGPTPGPFGS
ncbi:MAG: HU family DNA-binding protein [Planctomycetota bacterium JB042]